MLHSTLLHSQRPILWSFGRSEYNRVDFGRSEFNRVNKFIAVGNYFN